MKRAKTFVGPGSLRPRILSVAGSFTGQARAAVELSGGSLRLLGDVTTVEEIALAYQQADGLLFLGGRDVSPALYEEETRHAQMPDTWRDFRESWLVSWALKDRKPMLGICRGHQMIAVMAGGTLYQDIREELGVSHEESSHKAALIGEKLQALFGKSRLRVNSYHHQAVRDVPEGFKVEALSEEGIIEALSAPNIRTVQWHPEVLASPHTKLFAWLARRARECAAETATLPL